MVPGGGLNVAPVQMTGLSPPAVMPPPPAVMPPPPAVMPPPQLLHSSSGLVSAYCQSYNADHHYAPNNGYSMNPHHHHYTELYPANVSVTASLPSHSSDNNGYGYYDRSVQNMSISSLPSYQSVHSATDCYGVPAHPSVSIFPSQYNGNYRHQDNNNYAQHQQVPFTTNHTTTATTTTTTQPQHSNNNYLPSYGHHDFPLPNSAEVVKPAGHNSSRQQRNNAEKQRRNKLNNCINELSQLVPLISNNSKKVEKTSVLRLSAAYLRLSRLLMGFKEQREEMPKRLNCFNLADLMLDDRDIYLIVTSAGKIVFVSHSVESILGHPQIDLMGQSLFNITCIEDSDELASNLKFRDETSSCISVNDTTLNSKLQRRSFYIRLVKKAVSRGEQPELELVHVVGTLMVQNTGTKKGENNVVLNAVVRPFNERRVTEVSLMEATREEYITRHQLDGLIIYVDHRISIVSGFLPHEVSGKLAFTYMHKDDVRWVMIALRQMYFKGQSFGSSCYRLLSKNGEFVYMKTHGYLELNPDGDSVESFICVNTLVSPEEGKREILKMREKFTPLIYSQAEPGITAITDNQLMEADSTTSLEDASTEDPLTIDKVVKQMTINIPAPAIDNVRETAQNPGPLPDSQYLKVALLSKSMPKATTASNAPKIDKRSSLSPQPNVKPLTQDRPSVLRVAPPIAREPVLVYNQQTNEKSAELDREYYERRGGILVVPKRHNDMCIITEHTPKKPKVVLVTEIDSPACSQYSNQMNGSQSDNQLSTDGYGSLDEFSSFQGTPIEFSTHSVDGQDIDLGPLADENMTGHDHFSKTLGDSETSVDPIFLTPESYNSYDPGAYTEESPTNIIQDPIMHVLKHDGNVGSELLQQKQIALKSKMDQQQGQLKEIQTELNSLSSNVDTRFLTTNLSTLKAAHEKQQEMLRTLQGVHQNIGV